MPKISVIIPVYNVETYLRQCLDSIINQTLKDIEIICVDDGSTDNSLEILKEYADKDNRIHILQQQNQYAGVARNNGLKIAKGKYLSFLDSDDFFRLDMLEKMYNLAEKDNSDIVICGWYNYNNNTKKTSIHLPKTNGLVFNPEKIKKSLFLISYPNPWTKLFKKSLFLENDLYFENFIRCNDLTCVYTALSVANKISILKEPLVYYRSNQKTNLSANRSNNFNCFIHAINKLYENLIKRDKYNIYKQTFIERLLNSLKKELSFCDNKKAVYIEIKKLINKDLYEDIKKHLNKIFNVTEPIKYEQKHLKVYHKNKYF